MMIRWIASLLVATFLIGCRANQDSLDDFITQTQQQAQFEAIVPVPILALEIADYQAHSERSPFVLPRAALVMSQFPKRPDCWQPQTRIKTGQLEQFALNKLSLKGVMSRNGDNSALVQMPNGHIVKVTKGQYLGLNNGRIAKVTASYIQVNETLPDGLGCWSRRNVKLALR